jgi:nucleoside-diphosphate-sugar epimerase
MSKRVFVTGATGFTGSHVVPLLLRNNYQVRCLVRKKSKIEVLPPNEVELVYGDLDDHRSLAEGMQGMDILVNIASLGFGHAPNIVGAAVAARIRRGIFISTTAVNTSLNAPSKSVRLMAEDIIRRSGMAFTILRPTMIFGSSRDRNICRLIRYLNRWPMIPVIGDGEYLQQPVHVGDLASAIVQALESGEGTMGQTYNISGESPVTYNQLIETVCRLMARKVRKIHLPARPIIFGLTALQRLPVRLPIKAEQVQRLNEHKAFDHSAASRDFGYRPRSLSEAIRQELEEMGLEPVSRVTS